MLDEIFSFALEHGKLRAFCCVGFGAFTASFVLFFLLMSPLAAFHATTWGVVLGGATGCGIGTGIMNAIFAAVRT